MEGKYLPQNQKGFTLIEIIAVLVILGILMAVAIPKYFAMQDEAQIKAVEGALAALQSTATMDYAQHLLGGNQANSYTPSAKASNAVLGDFNGSVSLDSSNDGVVILEIKTGPVWFNNVPEAIKRKTLKLY